MKSCTLLSGVSVMSRMELWLAVVALRWLAVFCASLASLFAWVPRSWHVWLLRDPFSREYLEGSVGTGGSVCGEVRVASETLCLTESKIKRKVLW